MLHVTFLAHGLERLRERCGIPQAPIDRELVTERLAPPRREIPGFFGSRLLELLGGDIEELCDRVFVTVEWTFMNHLFRTQHRKTNHF